jgi:hypothetical protein
VSHVEDLTTRDEKAVYLKGVQGGWRVFRCCPKCCVVTCASNCVISELEDDRKDEVFPYRCVFTTTSVLSCYRYLLRILAHLIYTTMHSKSTPLTRYPHLANTKPSS